MSSWRGFAFDRVLAFLSRITIPNSRPAWIGYGSVAAVVICLVLLVGSQVIRRTAALRLYESGQGKMRSGLWEEGVAPLEEAMARGREWIPLHDTYVMLCLARMSSGGDQAIMNIMDAALESFPDSRDLNVLSLVLQEMGPDSTRAAYASAELESFKGYVNRQESTFITLAFRSYGVGRTDLGEWNTALTAYRRALEFSPATGDVGREAMAVFLRLIRAFLDIGRVQQALQAYELILDYDETLSPARLGRDLRQMTATLERVLELGAAASSESAASYRAQYLVLSRLYEETGQHDRAEATRRQVDDDLGGDTDAYVELGLTLHQMDELEESTRAFRKALAYDGGNLTARVNIGWNLYRQGKVEESIAEYESVLESASISPRASCAGTPKFPGMRRGRKPI